MINEFRDQFPISIKGVVFDTDGRVLLGLKERGDWELLGGRIEDDEHPRATLKRELLEEAGLTVEIDCRPVEAMFFDVLSNRQSIVFVVAYRCTPTGNSDILQRSVEHLDLCWFGPEEACELDNLPRFYKYCIESANRFGQGN